MVKYWNKTYTDQTKSDWVTYYYHQTFNLLLVYQYTHNLQGYLCVYGYTFLYTLVCRRMRNSSFDSYHISKSPLNSVVAVVFVFYSVFVQFGMFWKLKEFTTFCTPAKKEHCASRFGHPLLTILNYLSSCFYAQNKNFLDVVSRS